MQNSQKAEKPTFTMVMQSHIPTTLSELLFVDQDGNVYSYSKFSELIDYMRSIGHAIELAIDQNQKQILMYVGVVHRKIVRIAIRPSAVITGAPIILKETTFMDVNHVYQNSMN